MLHDKDSIRRDCLRLALVTVIIGYLPFGALLYVCDEVKAEVKHK